MIFKDASMKAGDQLLNEFSDITVEYIFGDYQHRESVYDNDNDEIKIYNHFDVIFQGKFKRPSIEGDMILPRLAPDAEYFAYLHKLRLSYYEEINELLEKESSSFRIFNKLLNFNNRFKELLNNYYNVENEDRYDEEVGYIFNLGVKEIYERNMCGVDFTLSSIAKDSFFSCQVKTLKLIIPFLEEKIELIKTFPKEKEVNPLPISIKTSIKIKPLDKESFELNPELFNSDQSLTDKLLEFKNLLLQYGYIEQIDSRLFMQVFKNQNITKPIEWLGTPGELYYLVKNLYDKNIIIRFKNYWSVACKCFIAYDKRNNKCTPYYLQRCKSPTRGEQLRKLNSVIDTLQ